jgi:hypothetical protein
MNGISIPINVDTSRITAAIAEIKKLHQIMGNVPALTGMEQHPGVSAGVQQMQQLQGTGNRGGYSDMNKQMAGLDATTRRIATNFQTWQTAAAKARAELKQISTDLAGLNKASLSTKLAPSTRGVMLTEIQHLESRRKELEREASRAEARAAGYERRLPENWQQQQQQNPNQPGQNTNDRQGWNGMKRLLGYGLAAAGGFSVASFISQSRGDYRQAIDHEGPLYARGIRGSRERAASAAGIGMSPLEYYGMEERLSASTGLSERSGIARHAMLTGIFAKAQGVDVGEATKLRESVFHATGDAGKLPTAALLAIGRSTAEGFDKSKTTLLLAQIEKSVGLTASATNGAGLSKQQLAADMAFALAGTKLDGAKGVFARSQELGNVMQNGLQGAGTGAGDIRLFSAMGGFDGPMTWEKIHELNSIKQGGFMQRPDLLNKILGGLSGSDAAKAGQLESLFPQWGLGAKGSSTLIDMHKGGFFDKLGKSNKGMLAELEAQAKGGDKQAAQWLSDIQSNPALGRQATEATKDAVKIEAGERLSKIFEPLELSAAKMAGALADGQWQKSFGILGDAAGQMGPAAKIMAGAAGLFALGGALSAVGGLSSLKGGAAAGMLGRLAPLLLNPVTGGVAAIGGTFGAIGWAGADNDKNLKRGQTDKELTDRYHQLEVQGNPNGPEGQRIKVEMQRRKAGGAAAQPKPRGWYQHQDAIRHSAMLYNVPLPILAGLLESESGLTNSPMRTEHYANGKPFKVGGIAQFTEATAKARGVDPMNPASAIPGSAKYLRELYEKTGSWDKAVAQYKGIKSEKNLWQRDTALYKAQKYTDEVDPQTAATVRELAPAGSGPQALPGDPTFQQQLLDILGAIAGNTQQQPPSAAPIAVK